MNKEIQGAVEQLICRVKESDTYHHYTEQLARLKEYPELRKQVDDYRSRNFELQTAQDVSFDRIDQFQRDYEGFRENPIVEDFLAAELAFCRMIQELELTFTEQMNFE